MDFADPWIVVSASSGVASNGLGGLGGSALVARGARRHGSILRHGFSEAASEVVVRVDHTRLENAF